MAFERLLAERLREAYPPNADGVTLFPFRRLFFVATRTGTWTSACSGAAQVAAPRAGGARLLRMRCSERRCIPSRRAVSLTLRPHCSWIRWMYSQQTRCNPSGVSGTFGSGGRRSSNASSRSRFRPRLAEIVGRPRLQRPHDRREARDVGDDHDPHPRLQTAQPADQVDAVAIAQPHLDHAVGESLLAGSSSAARQPATAVTCEPRAVPACA